MRVLWGVALVVVGCSSSYGADAPPGPPTNGGGAEGGASGDAGIVPDVVDGAVVVEAGADGGGDAGDAGAARPFDDFIALRLETDAPNGLQVSGVWRDLSKAGRSISVASGTPVVQFSGDAGAQAMVFGAAGPIFEVPDSADLRFGPTDDFMVVARATIELPAGTGNGCAFHYLFAKYGADGATGPHLRVCADTGRDLIGSLKLVSTDAKVAVPLPLTTGYGVVSFGRNLNGTRIETYAGGTSIEVNVPTPVDVSSVGSPFMLGGFRIQGTGGLGGSWLGKVNRLYVYHAPGGTFSAADFATIRAFVKDAAPLP